MPKELNLLKNKVSIITGAAHGIGKIIAKVFAECGSSVIISDIDTVRGRAFEKYMQEGGFNLFFYNADLRKEKDIESLINFTGNKFGKLDCLVNNARPKLTNCEFPESMEEWNLAMDVLLKAPALLAKHALPYLSESKGNIINISSTNAFSISHQPLSYHVAKTGIIQLTKCLAYELGPKGIRANAICPGLVNIYDEDKPIMNHPINGPLIETIVPLKRAADAEEIAYAAAFLSSKYSRFTTGAVLVIDSGATLVDPLNIAQKTFYNLINKNKKI